eukprot:1147791-Pelagomonas_calceolata.AAC.2
MDHSLRPQSRMAEDLVMESARGKDKAGVSRSTTNENLASLPKPQRVITSQQQQQQQQQPQETYGKGSGAASGVGSVMGWGFQLPLDGEGSQEHVSSPFEVCTQEVLDRHGFCIFCDTSTHMCVYVFHGSRGRW